MNTAFGASNYVVGMFLKIYLSDIFATLLVNIKAKFNSSDAVCCLKTVQKYCLIGWKDYKSVLLFQIAKLFNDHYKHYNSPN